MSKPICPHCKEDNCYEHCYESPDGQHAASRTSIHGNDGYDEEVEGHFVCDVNCKHCGQSGAVTVRPADIQWA